MVEEKGERASSDLSVHHSQVKCQKDLLSRACYVENKAEVVSFLLFLLNSSLITPKKKI